MGISSPGIGSNLDINGIVAKLMQAEARPLTALAQKEASYQAKLSAFGTLSGSLSGLQTALNSLNNLSTFKGVTANSSDSAIFSASATSSASPGTYSINVTQLAQAQTISSGGLASTTATIGTGRPTKLTFQFGTISGGNYVTTSARLSAGIATSGIAANSLSINGKTITTGGSTTSAKALADQINLETATTNVTATAKTDSGELGTFATTSAAGYSLTIGGVGIVSNAAGAVTASDLQTAVDSASASLTAAGISVSGTVASGDLKFSKADGTNLAIQESGAGVTGGFTSTIGIGTTKTFAGTVSLSSAATINIGGTNPAAAGLVAGSSGPYTFSGAGFALDANQPAGTVTIDSTNNSLQGIRDAINKANMGVTASIVSDGSATPNHLVIKSNKTGATSSMKISVADAGDPPDPALVEKKLVDLLAYDPAGTQSMAQSVGAQSAALSVNGIAVSSTTNTVTGAIEGATLSLSKVGSANLTVSANTAAVTSAVNAFVKAYNDVNSTIRKTTGYDEATKQAGVLLGDSSVRNIQSQLRKMMSTALTGSNGSLTTLSQIGISIAKDGTMSVDSGKLSSAMSTKMDDVAALFSSFGSTSDSLIKFEGSTSSSAAGTYKIALTQLASQGKVTGSIDIGATTTIDNTNKDLTVTVDGVTASVSLATGSYTSEALVTQVQSAINSASALSSAGIAVNVKLEAGKLVISSNKYGSTSKVSITGSGAATLLGTPTVDDGKDVAGTIGGGKAIGSGQYLTGDGGSPAAGLKFLVSGGAAAPAPGADRGTVTFSFGYAHQLNKLVEGFLGSSGVIGGRTDGLNRTIKDLTKQNEIISARLAATEERYRKQFTALDTLISKMNSTSTYLTQQLAQISKMSGE